MTHRLTNGFWKNGRNEYLRALRDEEAERIKPLCDALKFETAPQARQKLKEEKGIIRAEFKRKRRAAGSSLFSAT